MELFFSWKSYYGPSIRPSAKSRSFSISVRDNTILSKLRFLHELVCLKEEEWRNWPSLFYTGMDVDFFCNRYVGPGTKNVHVVKKTMRWIDHVFRIHLVWIPKITTRWTPAKKRKRGRPIKNMGTVRRRKGNINGRMVDSSGGIL